MNIVVGTGPAGVSCASALLAAGEDVQILDGGLRLEEDRSASIASMAGRSPEEWTAEELDGLRAAMAPSRRGIPLKMAYGSDFAFRGVEESTPIESVGVELRPSLAHGGLSNVWGATMLPYSERELRGWPITVADLAPHYAAVARLTGLAAVSDALSDRLPLYSAETARLEPSRAGQRLLERGDRHTRQLNRAGFFAGRSRLAVRAPQGTRAGCRYCGLCMYGCPYGYIYNSAHTLEALRATSRCRYEPDAIVETVREDAGGVTVVGHDRLSRSPRSWRARKVFLAAGPLNTTRILLASRSERRAWLLDSQYFLFPLLLFGVGGGALRERMHTLSQMFVELVDDAWDPHTVHVQLYTFNDMIPRVVAGERLARTRVVRALAARLAVAQAYLHSDHSTKIGVELVPRAENTTSVLRLTAHPNPATRRRARQTAWRFVRQSHRLGALALPPFIELGGAGRGYHSGGSFPMSANPGPTESDLLGRPHGLSRVFAVDSTVFPSIPATTITFSVMANAHRIGTEAVRQ